MIIEWNNNWTLRFGRGAMGLAAKNACTVTLPHDAIISDDRDPNSPNGPAGGWYNGRDCEYSKTLSVPKDWEGKVIVLELGRVAQNAMVYVNNQFAGKCPNPYINFDMDISGMLVFGAENTICIQIKSNISKMSRWYIGCGVLGTARLIIHDQIYIDNKRTRIKTLLCDEKYATVQCEIKIINKSLTQKKVQLESILYGPNSDEIGFDSKNITISPSSSSTIITRICIKNPSLWSIDEPSLCSLKTSISHDNSIIESSVCKFGVRTISLCRDSGFQVNRIPVKLRGACIHHDNGIIGGVSMKDAELRRVQLLKQAGFNAIRSAHNPASTELLEACDEVGMLVMNEAFDTWNTSKTEHDYSLYFNERWQEDISAMIDMSFNHPSVVMYSIGNEIPEASSDLGSEMCAKIANYVRSHDDTRIIVNCVNGMLCVLPNIRTVLRDIVPQEIDLPDDINALMTVLDSNLNDVMCHDLVTQATQKAFSGIDLCGYNYMYSRYIQDGNRYPNRMIVGSETYTRKIGYAWPIVEKLPYVIGDFCWTGWDYIGEAGVAKNDYELTHQMYGPWPYYLSGCGDFDICGKRRPQSYYREIVFGRRSKPYIAVEPPMNYGRPRYMSNWTWADVIESWSWPGYEEKPIHVEVYAPQAAEEVELFIDSQLIAKSKVGDGFPFTAVFDITYRPGTLRAIATGKDYQESCELSTCGAVNKIVFESTNTTLRADNQALLYLDILLADSKGQPVTYTEKRITLSVEGPAVIVGYGNSDTESIESVGASTHNTFRGRSLAVLRSTGTPGTVTVIASAEGVDDAIYTCLAE